MRQWFLNDKNQIVSGPQLDQNDLVGGGGVNQIPSGVKWTTLCRLSGGGGDSFGFEIMYRNLIELLKRKIKFYTELRKEYLS